MKRAAAPPALSRRRAKTRTALIDAARGLFAARGVDAVSIDEIVAAADVAKGTFYNHFTDKDALAGEVGRSVRTDLQALVRDANDDVTDPALRVARGVCIVARFAQQHPERARAMTKLFAGAVDPESPVNTGLRDDVRAALAAGRFSGTRQDAMVLFVMGTAHACVARILEKPTPSVASDTAEAMGTLMLRGLGLSSAEAQRITKKAVADILSRVPAVKEKSA